MKSAVIVFMLDFVVLTGCGANGSASPGIPDSLLVDVLVDVYSATARARLDGTNPDSARVEALAHFGLDTVSLNRTLHYFAENPDSAATVYQRALDSLIVVQRNLRSAPELDSLSRHIHG